MAVVGTRLETAADLAYHYGWLRDNAAEIGRYLEQSAQLPADLAIAVEDVYRWTESTVGAPFEAGNAPSALSSARSLQAAVAQLYGLLGADKACPEMESRYQHRLPDIPTFDALRGQSTATSGSDLLRTGDEHLGELVYASGTVVEWSELDFHTNDFNVVGYRLRLSTDGGGEAIAYHYGERVVENDRVEVVGTVLPETSYTTVLGAERTLPALAVVALRRVP